MSAKFKFKETDKITFIKGENMKITSVRYQRVVNLGNYETERVEAEAELDDEETPDAAAAALKQWVNEQLGLDGENMTDDEYRRKKRAVERFEQRRGR